MNRFIPAMQLATAVVRIPMYVTWNEREYALTWDGSLFVVSNTGVAKLRISG
ncbi:hypothetical protein N9D23_04765 [Rubripirellula sp.]|jgi:hypothetical protein|nr:hypothetical protein [Rubripirellula sp.]